MKRFLLILAVLLLPVSCLAVTLDPGEEFECNEIVFKCMNQTCPACECGFENCTEYIEPEWNKTYKMCHEMTELYETIEYMENTTELHDEIEEYERKFTELNANYTVLQGSLEDCNSARNKCDTDKKNVENERILYGAAGVILASVYWNRKKWFPSGGQTTGTEGGYEPSEVV